MRFKSYVNTIGCTVKVFLHETIHSYKINNFYFADNDRVSPYFDIAMYYERDQMKGFSLEFRMSGKSIGEKQIKIICHISWISNQHIIIN